MKKFFGILMILTFVFSIASCSRQDEVSNPEHTDAPTEEKTDEESKECNHNFSDWEVVKEATCETAGEEKRTCSKCGEVETREIKALGHDWQEATYKWEPDYSKMTATRVCSRDNKHVETETVNAVKKVEVEATYEQQGLITYTATFENKGFETQVKEVITSKLEHTYEENPTYTWSEDNKTVTATLVCKDGKEYNIVETVDVTSQVTKKATCEAKGLKTLTATFTNEVFKTQTKTLEIEALGHNYGEVSYTWNKDNTKLTATRTCSNDSKHVETETVDVTKEVQAATCTEKGKITYTAKAFTNKAFEAKTKEVEIPALGHNFTDAEYTWSEDYTTVQGYRKCPVCELEEKEIVHTTKEVITEATYETTGLVKYTAVFKEEGFETQTKEVTIPKLEKTYKAAVYTWSEDKKTVTAVLECIEDSKYNIEKTVNVVVTVTKAATCTEAGSKTLTATFTGAGFETQTKTEVIPALNHNYGEVSYTWNLEKMTLTAKRICQNDQKHVEEETVSITYKVVKAPTCLEKGLGRYTSNAFENKAFEVQTQDKELAATGHDYTEVKYTWSKDYAQVTAYRKCNNCILEETIIVDTDMVVIKEATIETEGLVRYTAVFDEKGFETQTKDVTTPKLEKTYKDPVYTWSKDNKSVTATLECIEDIKYNIVEKVKVTEEVTKAATCTEAGSKTLTATFTNEKFAVQTKEITLEKLGHKYVSKVVAPTCTEQGYTLHTCSVCGDNYKDTYVEATGHKYGEVTYTWNIEKLTLTAKRVCQNDKDHVEEETVKIALSVTSKPTCDNPGYGNYISEDFKNPAFKAQKKLTTIDALGHNWSEVSYTWDLENNQLTAKRVCQNGNHPEEETVHVNYQVITKATCEKAGLGRYTSKEFKNPVFKVQSQDVTIKALGHDYSDIKYTWNGNTSVTATATCAHDATHKVQETVNTILVVEEAATCTKTGIGHYETEAFTSKLFVTQISERIVIGALNHNYSETVYTWDLEKMTLTAKRVCQNDETHIEEETVTITYKVTKVASCSETGIGRYTSNAFENEAFEVQTKDITLEKLPHTYETKVVAPTCTEKGYTLHTCSVCKDSYKDTYVDAIGHNYGKVTYTWDLEKMTLTATHTCQNDETHVEEETVAITYKVVEAATCLKDGLGRYTANAFEITDFEVQTKEVVIKATGHDWEETIYSWNKDHTNLTATRVCKNDKNHVETETVKATYKVVTEPTCEVQGLGRYTSATFNNKDFNVQEFDVKIPVLGHNYANPTYEWNGTTSVIATATCTRNSEHKLTETVDVVWVVDKKATCTETGLGHYETKAFTNTIFTIQKGDKLSIDMIPHTYESKVVAPTCTEKGYTLHTCSVCGHSYKDTYVDALNHNYGEVNYKWNENHTKLTATRVCLNDEMHIETETVDATYKVVTAATCTKVGLGRYTSNAFSNEAFEVQTFDVELEMIPHTYESKVVAPTCTEQGYTLHTCSVCGHNYKDTYVAATGHNYGKVVYTWDLEKMALTAKRVCQNDEMHIEEETVAITYEVVTKPTCEVVGKGTYTSNKFTNSAFTIQTKDVEIEALGHDWNEATYHWSDDLTTITATHTCKRDGKHTESETVKVTKEVVREVSYEQDGLYRYTSEAFSKAGFTVQSKELVIPKLESSYSVEINGVTHKLEKNANPQFTEKEYILNKVSLKANDKLVFNCNLNEMTNITVQAGDNNVQLVNGEFVIHNDVKEANIYLKFNEGKWTIYVTGFELPNEELQVYYHTTWTNPRIWAWLGENNNLIKDWPGAEMTKVQDRTNWFTYTLKAKSFEGLKLLFNNGADGNANKKTGDLTVEGNKVYFYDNDLVGYASFEEAEKAHNPNLPDIELQVYYYTTWTNPRIWAWFNQGNNLFKDWPGAEMTKVQDRTNWFTYTLKAKSLEGLKLLFNDGAAGDANKKTGDLTVEGNKVYFYEKETTGYASFEEAEKAHEKPVDPNQETAVVNYYNSLGWENVYCYAYTKVNGEDIIQLGAWPGTKLSLANEVYKVEIKCANINDLFIIFNNDNGTQTPNLKYSKTEGELYFYGTNSHQFASLEAVKEAIANENKPTGYEVTIGTQTYPLVINKNSSGFEYMLEKAVIANKGDKLVVKGFKEDTIVVSQENNNNLDENFNIIQGGEVNIYVTKTENGWKVYAAKVAKEITITLTVNDNWAQGNARFAVYLKYKDGTEGWKSLTGIGGKDYTFTVDVTKVDFMIFCRMNPGNQDNNWGNKWNQTVNLKGFSENKTHYTVPATWWNSSTDEGNWN